MKVYINGTTWSIERCNNNELPLSDGMFFGKTFFFDRKIYLNSSMDRRQLHETLRHELTHAFLYETQIISQEEDFKFTEEMLCIFVGKYGTLIEEIAEMYIREIANE